MLKKMQHLKKKKINTSTSNEKHMKAPINCFFIYEKEIHCFLQQQRAALPLPYSTLQRSSGI